MNAYDDGITLDRKEAREYRGILSAAFNAASAYNGSQPLYNLLMDKLISMEGFIRERHGGTVSEEVEEHFAQWAGVDDQPNTISALLDHASARAYGRLSRMDGLQDMLAALSESGAVIVFSNDAFVLCDDGEPRQAGADGANKATDIKEQPRLALLIRELQTIDIYTDDLILHVGTTPEQTARKLPYVVVEIPRLKKQVAVCDQYGEITFVSQKILPGDVWGSRTKVELKAMKAMDVVRFGANWATRVCGLLTNAKPEPAPDPSLVALVAAFMPPTPPDLGDWRTNAALTADRIYQSVSETFAETGELPRAHSGLVAYGPLKGLLTWKNVDQELKDEYRSSGDKGCYLAGSIAKFCDVFGFTPARDRKRQATPGRDELASAAGSRQPS